MKLPPAEIFERLRIAFGEEAVFDYTEDAGIRDPFCKVAPDRTARRLNLQASCNTSTTLSASAALSRPM